MKNRAIIFTTKIGKAKKLREEKFSCRTEIENKIFLGRKIFF